MSDDQVPETMAQFKQRMAERNKQQKMKQDKQRAEKLTNLAVTPVETIPLVEKEGQQELLQLSHNLSYVITKGKYNQKYSVRTIPYFIGGDGGIHMMFTHIKAWGDWTAFGGSCKKNQQFDFCASKEIFEESRRSFTVNQYNKYVSNIPLGDRLIYSYTNMLTKTQEFLQFLPIEQSFSEKMIKDYYIDVESSPVIPAGMVLYDPFKETAMVKISNMEDFKTMIFCVIERAAAIKRHCIAENNIPLIRCLDISIVCGLVKNHVDLINYIIKHPESSDPKHVEFINQLMAKYPPFVSHLSQLLTTYNNFKNNLVNAYINTIFIDYLFGAIFHFIEENLRSV